MVAPLDLLLLGPGHIIAQVIEAELVVSTVGDISLVLLAANLRTLISQNHAGFHTQETEDPAHKISLVLSQVIINRHNMDALTG